MIQRVLLSILLLGLVLFGMYFISSRYNVNQYYSSGWEEQQNLSRKRRATNNLDDTPASGQPLAPGGREADIYKSRGNRYSIY